MITIDELINRLPLLAGPPFEITRLDGWSNHTFLLKREAQSFVVRIPVHTHVPWLNRFNESQHVKALAGMNITPRTVYDDPITGVAIREYLPGHVISHDATRITESQLAGMSNILKKLHNSSCTFSSLSLFDFMTRDLNYIAQYSELDPRYAILKNYLKTIAQKWPRLNVAPCHMDPNPHNFLCTTDKVWLIDFEYAGQCDPAWDLAYTITYCNLSKKQENIFLSHYAPDASMLSRIQDYKALTQLTQAIWIRLQFTFKHHPIPEEDMLRWEDRALERAIGLQTTL